MPAAEWTVMVDYRLPHDPASAATARTDVTEELSSVLDPSRVHDSQLMVTELVSNAVRHAPPGPDGNVVLEIEREPAVVRIVVRDGGTHIDPNDLTFDTVGGHFGLRVIDTLSDEWGFSIDGDKGVSFEMRVDPASEPSDRVELGQP